ncbi:MAG TPA: formyltransferase family protein [Ktedonobacteraceae bacterium]|nr:formyltransferase family protein [Ktedonobacteraceae bacterium]
MSQSALPSMRIIFFSNQPPLVVNAIIEGLQALGQQVPLLVTTAGPRRRPNQNYHQIVALAPHDLDVLVTNHMERLPTLLRPLEPDVVFTAGFPWKLPPALLELPRLGSINAHPALLPKYRGPEPVFWQLMNGEKQTGLTIHRMDAEFDTGPILVQRAIDISDDDDADSIFVKLLPLGMPMLPLALASVARGDPGIPQPEEGSYAPIPGEADRHLDWSRSAVALRNQVRAWGSRGAFAGISGKIFLVRRARVISPPLEAQPGILLDNSEGGLLVQTGHDALLIQDFEEIV